MTDFARLVLSADTTGLVSAEAALDSITQRARKAQSSANNFKGGMREAGTASQFFSKSAKESAQAFQAFDKAQMDVAKLAAAFDPSVANALKLHDAIVRLDSAFDMGAISQAEYDRTLASVSSGLMATDAATDSVTTSLQAHINSVTGVTRANAGLASSSAEVFQAQAQLEAQLDNLRRSYDTVYANSKRYEAAVKTLDAALDAGIISQAQHTRMLEQSGNAMLRIDSQAAKLNRTMGGVQGNIGNMTAQLNDIGTMMVAGQSPLLLAFQQGTQVSQAFDSMGEAAQTSRQRIGVLGNAFKQALSPANLLILVAVGATAAIGQFGMSLLGLSKDAETSEDAVRDLATAIGRIEDFSETAAASQEELAVRFGSAASEARKYARIMREIARMEAIEAQIKATEALSEDFATLKENIDAVRNAGDSTATALSGSVIQQWISELKDDFGVTRNQAFALRDALRNVDEAVTATGRNEALGQMLEVLFATRNAAGEVPSQLLPLISIVGEATIEGRRLQGAIDGSNGPAAELAQRLGGIEGIVGGIVSRFNAFRNSLDNLSVPFENATEQLEFEVRVSGMGETERLVATRVRRLRAEMLRETQDVFGEDAVLTPNQERELAKYEDRLREVAPALTATGDSAQSTADKIKDLTLAQSRARDALRDIREENVTYNQVLKELDKLLDSGKISMGEYAEAVKVVRGQFDEANEEIQFFKNINDDAKDSMLDMITVGEGLGDTFKNLGQMIARASFEAAIFGSGPLSEGRGEGMLGSLGLDNILPSVFGSDGVLSKVLPFDNGGFIPPRTIGQVAERGNEFVNGTLVAGPAQVTSRVDTERMTDSEGSQPININFNITTPDVEGFRRSQPQLAARAARLMSQGRRNM